MEPSKVPYGDKVYTCQQYQETDVAEYLDIFFFWKSSVYLAERLKTRKKMKNPQLPATFSEVIVCYLLDLLHNMQATGPDAFQSGESGYVPVEIKATITSTGYTDVKKLDDFHYLYWLDLIEYKHNKFEIYMFEKNDILTALEKKPDRGGRSNIGFRDVAKLFAKRPICEGYFGILSSCQMNRQQ